MLKFPMKMNLVETKNPSHNLQRSQNTPQSTLSEALHKPSEFTDKKSNYSDFVPEYESRRITKNAIVRSKKIITKYSEVLHGLGKKIISFQLIVAILVEFVVSPALFDLFADPFGDTFKRNTAPRGRLENYYNNGDRVKEEAEWDRITKSGKEVLSAEWESKAAIEIEEGIKQKQPGDDESVIRGELEVKKNLAKAEWEKEVTKEIDEKKGSWKAKINSVALNDLIKAIDIESLVQAVIDADALQKNTTGNTQDKVAAWDSIAKDRANLLRADWETKLSQQITSIKGSVVTLTSDEKTAFETELTKIELEFQAKYKWQEATLINFARQSLVVNLNELNDLDGAIAQETDPSKLVALLIDKTKRNIDENGDLKAEITQAYSSVPTSYDGISGDPNTKIQRALENGQKLWEKAIDDLLVQKLKFDNDATIKKNAGEDQWSRAYFELLKQRDDWSSKVNAQIQEGLKNWDTSEAQMKDNKEKALTELNRYIETSNVEWQSHVRGLEQVVVGSADTLKTIEDNIRWFDESISKLAGTGNTTAIGTYQAERAYWAGLRTKFQILITEAQNDVNEQDIRNNEYGVFPGNGEKGLLTIAEYELKLAKIELEALEKTKDRAVEVYNYALANSKKTKEEIQTDLTSSKTLYETKQKAYIDLLTELNGGGAQVAGQAGLDSNSTSSTQTGTPPTETYLQRLEAKNKELEEKRKALDLARADLDNAKKTYENVLKLQVYVQNPNLVTQEIGEVAALGDASDKGIRYQIYEANKNLEAQKVAIRQRESLIYQTMYEQENARRSRDYYQELNQRIKDFEKLKDDSSRLHALLDGPGDVVSKVNLLLSGDTLVKTYSLAESDRIKSELIFIKDQLVDLDAPISESITEFNKRLQPIIDGHSILNQQFTNAQKEKYLSYFSDTVGAFNKLQAVQGVDSEYLDKEDFDAAKEYYEELTDNWGDVESELNSNFTAFQTAHNDYKTFVAANVGQEGTEAYQKKVFEMSRVLQNYMRVLGESQTYFENLNRGFSALNVILLDSVQRSNAMVDSSLTGQARTDSFAAIKSIDTDYKVSLTNMNAAKTNMASGFKDVSLAVQNYAVVYSNFLTSKANKLTVLEQVSGFLISTVQQVDISLKIQEKQMSFLLDEDGSATKLDEISDEASLDAKKKGALYNQQALELLSDKINALGPNEKNYDVIYSEVIGELSDKLRDIKANESSYDQIAVLSIVKDYLLTNRVAFNNIFALPDTEYTKFLESLATAKDRAEDTLSFFNSGAKLTQAEIDATKEDGTDQEKRNLSDYYNYGSSFFFNAQIGPYLSSKLSIAGNLQTFGQKIKSGEMLSVLKDAYFQNQENKTTGLIKEMRDFVPGLVDYKSEDFFNDSSDKPSTLEKDDVEINRRRGILAAILTGSVESQVAALGDPAKRIEIFGASEANRVQQDLDVMLAAWKTDVNIVSEQGKSIKNAIESVSSNYQGYLDLFSSTNKQMYEDYALTLANTEQLKNANDLSKPIYTLLKDSSGFLPGDPLYTPTYIDATGKKSYQSGYDANQRINYTIVADSNGYLPENPLYVLTYIDSTGKKSFESGYDASKRVNNGYEKPLAGMDTSYLESTRTDLVTQLGNWTNIQTDLQNAFNSFKIKSADLLSYANAHPTDYMTSPDFAAKLLVMLLQIQELEEAHLASSDFIRDLKNKYDMSKEGKDSVLSQAKEILGENKDKRMILADDLASLSQAVRDDVIANPSKYRIVTSAENDLLKKIAKEDETVVSNLSDGGIQDLANEVSEELDLNDSNVTTTYSRAQFYFEKYGLKDDKIPQVQDVLDGLSDRVVVYKTGTQTAAISQDEIVRVTKGLREFFLEKSFKGFHNESDVGRGDVNSTILQALSEVEVFTNEIENLKYLQTNPPSNLDIASSDAALKKATEDKENVQKSVEMLGELENLLGSLDANGIPAYQSPEAMDQVLRKYNEITTKLTSTGFSFSGSVTSQLEALKEHVWVGYMKQVAISYLAGQAVNKDGSDFESLTQFMASIKAGKFLLLGADGRTVEKDAKFLGLALTDSQLEEIEDYLEVYDEKRKIIDTQTIVDLGAFIADKDPDLKEELKEQAMFAAYRRINGTLDQGSFIDLALVMPEMRNYTVVKTFSSYLNNMLDWGATPDASGNYPKKFDPNDANAREAAKNELVVRLGVKGQDYLTILNEYLANYSTRNESYYLDNKLKELNAVESYIFRTDTGIIKPGDMAKLTEWIVQEKYDSSVETALKKASRMDYLLKNYYGEKTEDYLEEANAKLALLDNGEGLQEDEKNLFLLTQAGFSPSSYFAGVLGYLEDPIESIQSQFYLENFKYTNSFESLQKDLTEEGLRFAKEGLNKEAELRKEKFVNDVKKGLVVITSFEAYLNIPKNGTGWVEPTQAEQITAKLRELEKHAELKMGSFLKMIEEYNSNAYLTPGGATDDKSRLSYSLQKTIQAVNENYDYTVDNELDTVANDGTFVFEKDLNINVITKLNNYVNATDVNFEDNSSFSIVQAAYGAWNGIKETIIEAGKRVPLIKDYVNSNLAGQLSTANTMYQTFLGIFDTQQKAFDQTKLDQQTELNNYTEQQKDTSDAYNEMLAAEKTFGNTSALYDYATMEEYAKHDTLKLDGNGNPIQDTTIASPLDLAKKRKEEAEKKYNDQKKKVDDLTKKRDEQVTLLELQNDPDLKLKKQEMEEWALRAMRFSEAERRIKDEITRLRAELQPARKAYVDKVDAAFGFSNPVYGLNLESYTDYNSANYLSSETALKQKYFYGNKVYDGTMNADTFIGMFLKNTFVYNSATNPGEKNLENAINGIEGSPLFANIDAITPANFEKLWNIGARNGAGNGVFDPSDQSMLIGFIMGGEGDAARKGIVESFGRDVGRKDLHATVQSGIDTVNTFMLGVGWRTCGPNPFCWFGIATAAGNRTRGGHEAIDAMRISYDGFKSDLQAKQETFLTKQAQLNALTQITDTAKLLATLGSNYGLTTEDLTYLKNTNGTFDGLTWKIDNKELKLNTLVGVDGNKLLQSRVQVDGYGLVVRDSAGNAYSTQMAKANEVADTLATLAETQYAVLRDQYYNMAKEFINAKGVKVDYAVVLNDRESFYNELINEAFDVGGTAQGAKNKMYKRLIRDYMGSDLAESGAKTVTNGLSIVDEAMLLKNSQIKEAELKAWAEKEKEFYQKKKEWTENVNFLKKTGEDRFKSIVQEFTNSREAWRLETDNKIKAESEKYTNKIKEAVTEQKNWVTNFSQQASSSNELTLRQMYDSIVETTSQLQANLPANVDITLVDANSLLQKYIKNKPQELTDALLAGAKNVNIDFFINEITGRGYDTKIEEKYAALQKELRDKSEVMVRLQQVYELFSLKDQYSSIIKGANEALKRSIDMEMQQNGWMTTDSGYLIVKQAGNITAPINIEGYKFYEYKPIEIPKIKDAHGKEWDLKNVSSLIGSDGPTGAELGSMVKVAQEALDLEFKKQYNPQPKGKGITYEQPSTYSLLRQQRAFKGGQASGDGSTFQWDISEYFLVGEVEKGDFGVNHHNEVWRIMTAMENVNLVEQAYIEHKQQQAARQAHREQIQDAVVTVAAVAVSFVPGCQMCGVAMYSAYSSYKAEKAYRAGGEKGAALSLASSAINFVTRDFGVSVNMSYTYADGYGASVGAAIPLDESGAIMGTGGLSWNEQDGFGVSLGLGVKVGDKKTGGLLNVGFSTSERGTTGVTGGYQFLEDGKAAGTGIKVGYNWDRDGNAIGYNASLTYTTNANIGNSNSQTFGLSFDQRNGFGAVLSASGRVKSGDSVYDIAGDLAWSQKGGFNSSFEMGIDWKASALAKAQKEVEEMDTQNKEANLEAAKWKVGQGYPLTLEEKLLLSDWEESQAKATEANNENKSNVVVGAGRAITQRRETQEEKAKIEVSKEDKDTIVNAVVKKVTTAIDKLLESEGNNLKELKDAYEEYKKTKDPKVLFTIIEKYENTNVSIGVGFTPVLGEVLDGLSIVKDLYKGDYFYAGISTLAAISPMLPAGPAKRLAKAFGDKLGELWAKMPWKKKVADVSGVAVDKYYDDLAKLATKNSDSTVVVLGKSLEDGKSYTKVAAHYKATYFKLDDWRELSQKLSREQLWEVNEAFLDQQIKAGKAIVLSHDPTKATGFFKDEVDYLGRLGYRFVKDGWTWRAVK